MKLKQYMQENAVTAFEVLENELVFSAIVGGSAQALSVDTSSVPNGTPLEIVEDFEVDGDTLTVAGITLNLNDVEILTFEEQLEQMKNI